MCRSSSVLSISSLRCLCAFLTDLSEKVNKSLKRKTIDYRRSKKRRYEEDGKLLCKLKKFKREIERRGRSSRWSSTSNHSDSSVIDQSRSSILSANRQLRKRSRSSNNGGERNPRGTSHQRRHVTSQTPSFFLKVTGLRK